MWRSIPSYIKYLLKAKTKYSVHSPFVFEFITNALEADLPSEFTTSLNAFRSDLLANGELIEVTDFGAGSKVFKSNQRKVNDIAKYAGISKRKARLIQKIVHYFQPTNILEVGTSLGVGTAAIHLASPDSKIISIEGCPETAKIAAMQFDKYDIENVQLHVGEFSKLLPELFIKETFDLIFFDGNHQKEATINYFNSCIQSTHNDTLLIFDDIHWSSEMEQAWKYIQKNTDVSLSLDLYDFGLAFFRKEQAKQDLVLRF